MLVSVVIPFYDEAATLQALHQQIANAFTSSAHELEIVFINDGSNDEGAEICTRLVEQNEDVTLIDFRRNFGKSAALSAGFSQASGDVIVTIDADLQDEPAEILTLVDKLLEGWDVVSGRKADRQDPLGKTLPSKLFNAVINKVFGLELHDHNCGLKAYKADAIDDLNLYGELHRYIPVLLHSRGFSVTEEPVTHHPRKFGHSKYGVSRIVKGALDLLTVLLTSQYGARPLHLFGLIGLLIGSLGFVILTYLSLIWVFTDTGIGGRPLFFLGILLLVTGGQILLSGLLAEFILRQGMREADKYNIRAIHTPKNAPQKHKNA